MFLSQVFPHLACLEHPCEQQDVLARREREGVLSLKCCHTSEEFPTGISTVISTPREGTESEFRMRLFLQGVHRHPEANVVSQEAWKGSAIPEEKSLGLTHGCNPALQSVCVQVSCVGSEPPNPCHLCILHSLLPPTQGKHFSTVKSCLCQENTNTEDNDDAPCLAVAVPSCCPRSSTAAEVGATSTTFSTASCAKLSLPNTDTSAV